VRKVYCKTERQKRREKEKEVYPLNEKITCVLLRTKKEKIGVGRDRSAVSGGFYRGQEGEEKNGGREIGS